MVLRVENLPISLYSVEIKRLLIEKNKEFEESNPHTDLFNLKTYRMHEAAKSATGISKNSISDPSLQYSTNRNVKRLGMQNSYVG